MKWILIEVADILSSTGKIRILDLLSHQGFMVYRTSTYRVINPHLKRLHHTVDSWRLYRYRKRWTFQGKKLLGSL